LRTGGTVVAPFAARGGPDMVTIKHHGRVIGRATLASKTHRLLLLAAPTDFRCVRFVARLAPSCKFCTALTLMSGICKCAREYFAADVPEPPVSPKTSLEAD